jgi:transcriptional repressor NrdR
MKCPFCSHEEDKVLDSRASKDGMEIRRRRQCLNCGRRFTTRETIQFNFPTVVKKDGKRETFSSEKIRSGLKKACEKRPISVDQIDDTVKKIEQAVIEHGEKEAPSSFIGELVVQELKKLDHVAYVRFASVYREFKDPSQFMEELENLISSSKK